MKTWAWILGGAGVAAGAWWYLKGRNPMTSATPESFYPEDVVPGVTPGYPIAPSADQLPLDTAQQMAPAMGESYAPTTQPSSSQASAVSAGYGEPATNTPSSSGASYAVGAGTGTSAPSPKKTFVLVKPITATKAVVVPQVRPIVSAPRPMVTPIAPVVAQPPKAILPQAPMTSLPSPMVSLPRPVAPTPSPMVTPKPIVSSPRPVVAPQPTKVTVTTYRSPVTSSTRTVVAPIAVAPRVVAAPKPKSPAPPVVTPLTRPLAVVRPTNVRGVYAVGADFTEAEYHAMAVKAELESKRREWAANQMSEQTNAINRVNR